MRGLYQVTDIKENMNKSVLITGAAKGLGRAIVQAFSEKENTLFLNYNTSEEKIEKIKEELNIIGVTCVPIQADISDPYQVKNMFKKIYEYTNSIDCLVNNAGVISRKSFIGILEKEWDYVMNVNLRGAFLCSKYAARSMIKNKEGVIINVLSSVLSKKLPMQASYIASKAGLQGLTEAMALELGPYGIRVNAVAPGPVNTEMNLFSDSQLREIVLDTPIRKEILEEDIAKAIHFLSSDEARSITGVTLTVDGGLSI